MHEISKVLKKQFISESIMGVSVDAQNNSESEYVKAIEV